MSTNLSSRLVANRIQRSVDKLIGSLVFTPPAEHGAKLQVIAELVAVINWLNEKEDNQMVIKEQVYNKKFELSAPYYVIDSEFDDGKGGTDTSGHTETVKFFITIQQLAAYLNDSYSTWDVAFQVTYLQAIFDNWSIDLYDGLFQDQDFVYLMYQDYGHNQSL